MVISNSCASLFRSEPIVMSWNEETDKLTLAKTFVDTHTADIEGLGCSKGDAECFTAVLFTHIMKTEEIEAEGGEPLPALNIGGLYEHEVEEGGEKKLKNDPFEAARLIREHPDFKELELPELTETTDERREDAISEEEQIANAFEAGKDIREAPEFEELDIAQQEAPQESPQEVLVPAKV